MSPKHDDKLLRSVPVQYKCKNHRARLETMTSTLPRLEYNESKT